MEGKPHNLDKLPKALYPLFTSRAYPFINKNTLELEWWVNKKIPLYQTIIKMFSNPTQNTGD
jgi:hypothetical protein